jgi:hypothetical protein
VKHIDSSSPRIVWLFENRRPFQTYSQEKQLLGKQDISGHSGMFSFCPCDFSGSKVQDWGVFQNQTCISDI